MSDPTLTQLRAEIVACRRCPRLVRCRERLAREKKREFAQEAYWGKPVPGFGDPHARLVVVGLAPAPHGGNRTGRVFTGDRSAAFLVRALHAAGFANQPTSLSAHDGLQYRDAWVTAAVRCVPPDNRPLPVERDACLPYLVREFRLLTNVRSYLALGGFAWDAVRRAGTEIYGRPASSVAFCHGAVLPLSGGGPLLWGSYHPSPLNTNTGRLTAPMFADVLGRIRASW